MWHNQKWHCCSREEHSGRKTSYTFQNWDTPTSLIPKRTGDIWLVTWDVLAHTGIWIVLPSNPVFCNVCRFKIYRRHTSCPGLCRSYPNTLCALLSVENRARPRLMPNTAFLYPIMCQLLVLPLYNSLAQLFLPLSSLSLFLFQSREKKIQNGRDKQATGQPSCVVDDYFSSKGLFTEMKVQS